MDRLWVIEFNVDRYDSTVKGCAVVKADNPNAARQILLHEGMYNGCPRMYEIIRIEEIIESPEPMLLCEQINE